LKINGDAIYDTRPWQIFGGKTRSGKDIRYTSKNGLLYIHLFEQPSDKEIIPGILLEKNAKVTVLGRDELLKWKQIGRDVEIRFEDYEMDKHVFVLQISSLPALVISE